MRAASIYVLSLASAVLCSPTLVGRDDVDWKTQLGWDGKTTTPAELDPSNVVKHTPNTPAAVPLSGGVYFCDAIQFKGNCLYVARFNSDQCVNFGKEFNAQVSSFGPDQGLACLLYDGWDCQGNTPGGWIIYPGANDLRSYNFNDRASSFKCRAA